MGRIIVLRAAGQTQLPQGAWQDSFDKREHSL